MKKKLSLSDLATCVQVLEKNEQKQLFGGVDSHDCFWRCIAYIFSGGTNYSAGFAMGYARKYFDYLNRYTEKEFDENNYAMQGHRDDYKACVKYLAQQLGYTGERMQILTFDPNTVPGWNGEEGYKHSVIITGYSEDGKELYIFDPKNGEYGTIKRKDIADGTAFVDDIRPQSQSYNGIYTANYCIDDFFDSIN